MTDTPEHGDEHEAGREDSEQHTIEAPRDGEVVANRLLVPLLLPILSIVGVAFLTINISRIFLASSKTIALVIAACITAGILLVAALISAAPRLKGSSLTMLLSTFAIVVMGGGLATLGPSLHSGHGGGGGGGGYQQPPPPADATLSVEALSSLKFDQTNYTISSPTGVVDVNYLCDQCGTHTLVFSDPKLAGFEEKVPQGPTKLRAKLPPGTYTIYCTIPGHRAAGMEATVTVTAG